MYIYVYRSPLSSMAATLSALAENLKGHEWTIRYQCECECQK